jgi:hypothetical protein
VPQAGARASTTGAGTHALAMQTSSAAQAGAHTAPSALASAAGTSLDVSFDLSFLASLLVAPAAPSSASFGWPSEGEGDLLLPHAASSVAASAIPNVVFSWSPPRES